MTAADWLIVVVVLLNVVSAAIHGFFAEALSMAGLVIGNSLHAQTHFTGDAVSLQPACRDSIVSLIERDLRNPHASAQGSFKASKIVRAFSFRLLKSIGSACQIILLGSIATDKYTEPLLVPRDVRIMATGPWICPESRSSRKVSHRHHLPTCDAHT